MNNNFTTSGQRFLNNQNGMLFAMTAIVLMVVLALATALATVLWAGHKSLQKQRNALQAFYFAQTSVEYSLSADDSEPVSFSGRVPGFSGHFQAILGGHTGTKYAIKTIGICNGVADTIWTVVEKKDSSGGNNKEYRLRSWKENR